MADCYYHGQSSPGPCPDCSRERRSDDGPRMRPPGYGAGWKWGSTVVPTCELSDEYPKRSLRFAIHVACKSGLALHWVQTNQGHLDSFVVREDQELAKVTENWKISTAWDGAKWTATSADGAKSLTGATRKEAAWRLFVLLTVGESVTVPNELLRYIDRNERPPVELNPEYAA